MKQIHPEKQAGETMVINYISTTMDAQDFATLFPNPRTMPGQQGPKFNRLLMEGLVENGVEVHACTGRPVNTHNCSRKFLPAMTRVKNERFVYRYGSVLNLPLIKNAWQMAVAYRAVCREVRLGASAVVCDVLNASIAFGASAAAKHRKVPCIGIVTDLPELLVTGVNARHVRMVRSVIDNCSGYVFLTEAMNERLNPARKPYTVIEGVCDTNMFHREKSSQSGSVRKCLYAGLLDARYGVKMMVEGFLQAELPDAELHIYGDGPYADELTRIAQQHRSIIYHGTVMNDVVVQAELEADLLINPRPTHEEFTRYSFPSKNMEYMATGTPVLTTCLSGMPQAYRPYVYLLEDETVQGVAHALQSVLSLPAAERNRVGLQARNFVLGEKNKAVQTKKIVDLIHLHHIVS